MNLWSSKWKAFQIYMNSLIIDCHVINVQFIVIHLVGGQFNDDNLIDLKEYCVLEF